MLIDFRVENFRSFRDEQVLGLVAGKDPSHPDNLISCGKFDLVKCNAIYGANASGKSNLLKAIHCMTEFVLHSATRMTLGDPIPGIVPFRLDADMLETPSRFEMTAKIGNTMYKYGFSATTQFVHSEWLKVYPQPSSTGQMWFERRYDLATGKFDLVCRGPLEREREILVDKTRNNGLVLSRAAELNMKPLTELFLWFRDSIWHLNMSADPSFISHQTAERVKKDERLRYRVGQMMTHADLGIKGLRVIEKPFVTDDLPKDVQEMLTTIVAFQEKHAVNRIPNLAVQTIHYTNKSNGEVEFSLDTDESSGTQRFFALLGPFLEALQAGTIMFVDELEASMHSLLTRKLIELFQSPKVNKKGAQLVFATHDSTLMDPELFRRDQMWLVEKNPHGASEIYTLYDFEDRPRNTTAFQRNYLAGRYGGVPQFGPTLEDLEFE